MSGRSEAELRQPSMTGEIAPSAGGPGAEVHRESSENVFKEQKETWGKFGYRTACMLVMTSPLVFAFGALFTSPMGWGWEVLEGLIKLYNYYIMIGGGGAVIFIMLYLFDFTYWDEGFWLFLKNVLLALGGFLLVVGALMATKDYPGMPPLLFMLMTPLILYNMKIRIYPDVSPYNFFFSIAALTLIVGAATLGLYIYWLSSLNLWWGTITRNIYLKNLPGACTEDVNQYCVLNNVHSPPECLSTPFARDDSHFYYYCVPKPGISPSPSPSPSMPATPSPTPALTPSLNITLNNSTDLCTQQNPAWQMKIVKPYCLAAFLMWGNNFIASGACLACAIICYYLGRNLLDGRVTRVDMPIKLFSAAVIFSVMGMWIAGEIAAASIKISQVVFMFASAFIMATVAVIVTTVGLSALTEEVGKIALVKSMGASLYSDWMKSLGAITSGPIFLMYLAVSWLNQVIRVNTPFGKKCKPNELKMSFTEVATGQVQMIMAWDWTSVIVKMHWWAIIFALFFVVVARVAYVFLSMLNDFLLGMSIAPVIGIFYGVGLFMFLLPPIPGVPVYICGGITMITALETQVPALGYFGALVVVCAIGQMLKFNAIVIQQKVFGEFLGSYTAIRSACAVNSVSIKAIRLILMEPGMSIAKVAILVGGPDWPTSVLTGILKLNVWEMLYGSIPCLMVVVPSTLSGAFMVKAGAEGGTWESISLITISLTALSQMCIMGTACYYIEEVALHRRDEIDAIPDDAEVKAEDIKIEEDLAKLKKATDWNKKLGCAHKAMLLFGAFCMTVACYLWQFLGTWCFEDFEITDKVADKLRGNPWNLLKYPYGHGSVALFAVGCLVLIIHDNIAAWRVSANEHKSGRRTSPVGQGEEGKVNSQALTVAVQ